MPGAGVKGCEAYSQATTYMPTRYRCMADHAVGAAAVHSARGSEERIGDQEHVDRQIADELGDKIKVSKFFSQSASQPASHLASLQVSYYSTALPDLSVCRPCSSSRRPCVARGPASVCARS